MSDNIKPFSNSQQSLRTNNNVPELRFRYDRLNMDTEENRIMTKKYRRQASFTGFLLGSLLGAATIGGVTGLITFDSLPNSLSNAESYGIATGAGVAATLLAGGSGAAVGDSLAHTQTLKIKLLKAKPRKY